MNGQRPPSRRTPAFASPPAAERSHRNDSRSPVDSVYEHALGAAVRDQVAQGFRRLLFTSSEPGEGKTTVVADVARTLALSSDESVAVIDTDQFRPTLHRHFGLGPARGLGDLLEEVYLFDLTREDGSQFGVGDWIELLRAQQRSGELRISEGAQSYVVGWAKGAITRIVCGPTSGDGLVLGAALVRSGRITSDQRDCALRDQEETGRPLGAVLVALGYVDERGLIEALNAQIRHRLQRLLALRQPECRFAELADRHLGVSSGRSQGAEGAEGIDDGLRPLLGSLNDPFLAGQVPAYLSETALTNLKVLTAGTRPCDLVSPRYHTPFCLLLERLTRTFDIVLLDATPVSLTTPASRLAALVDGVVLVVKSNGTEVRALRRTLLEVRRAGGNVLGAVLSEADVEHDIAMSPYYKVLAGYHFTPAIEAARVRRPSFQAS